MRKLVVFTLLILQANLSSEAEGVLPTQMILEILFDGSHWNITDRSRLSTPLHHAGYYAEFVNEDEFLKQMKPKKGEVANATVEVLQEEVEKFPDHYGDRANKFYKKYRLKILRVEPKAGME